MERKQPQREEHATRKGMNAWKEIFRRFFVRPLDILVDEHTHKYEMALWVSAELLLFVDLLVALWSSHPFLDRVTIIWMTGVLLILIVNGLISRKYAAVRVVCIMGILLGYLMIFHV